MIETTVPTNSCGVKKVLLLIPIDNANLPYFFCLRFSFIRKMLLFYLRFSFITNWASLQIISMDFIQFLEKNLLSRACYFNTNNLIFFHNRVQFPQFGFDPELDL